MQYVSPNIDEGKQTIDFYLQSDYDNRVSMDGINQVFLVGSFNHWSQGILPLNKNEAGVWAIQIPMLPKGTYYYKFLVDDKVWLEDVANPKREPDGFAGFNSVFMV